MKLLPWKQPNLIMKLAADYYRMPAAGGTTLRLRRYTKLVPPVVPLGNTGVTGPSQNLSAVDRLNVHYKSSLIDLKFRPHNGEDNKAQAAKACSVNVASEKTHRDMGCGALNMPVMA